MPSTEGGRWGWRLSQRVEFLRQRVMARWWNSWEVQARGSCGLAHWAIDFPSEWTMLVESSERQPRVSATMVNLQADKWDDSLRWVPTCRAYLGVEEAPYRVCCWRGEITWMITWVLRAVRGSMWARGYPPVWIESLGSHWGPPWWVPRQLTGRPRTERHGWHCGVWNDHHSHRSPLDGLWIGQRCRGTPGRSRGSCGGEPQVELVKSLKFTVHIYASFGHSYLKFDVNT